MQKGGSAYKAYVNILKEELIRAMGCTEPIAIAYAASIAKDHLHDLPDRIEICVSNNIIKNVKSVTVPNTDGLKGIEAACAIGIVAGKSDKVLEVIADATKEDKIRARALLKDTEIKIQPIDKGHIFDIIISLYKNEHKVTVRIDRYHTNVVYIKKDDEVILDTEDKVAMCDDIKDNSLEDKSLLNIADIYDFAQSLDIEDVKDVLDEQIACNTKIADEGLKKNYGANIGSVILKYRGESVMDRAIAKAAAASDARMSGCELPVVINSGSGNQGITVSIPVIEYAKELKVSDDRLYRALALSNLIAIHEKTGIGRLSAYCGAVSAGCAAGCGIAYLQGGDLKTIEHTLVNSLAVTSGIICDGAKASCAAKIAMSVEAGIMGYLLYESGNEFYGGDGIVAKGVERTIRNIGLLGREGMKETDKEIVKIMMQKD